MGKHCQWRERLQKKGYRLTIPREVIIEVLRNSTSHLSAEDIYMELHKKYPAIGLTTIYRTLELLVQMKIIVKFDFGDRRSRYELSEKYGMKKHHHHLICSQCTKIIDYTDFINEELELIEKTEKRLMKKYNFSITSHVISFTGICLECKKDQT
ncbi:MAG: transcriptional repressor [Spirochaetales bacterium]|nr:transcriptional repressor [Spirochaetales bacterium]